MPTKNLRSSLLRLCLTLIIVGMISNTFAQQRQVRAYHVIVNTNDGKVKGILERNNKDHIFIEKKNGEHVSIPVKQIKKMKVKEYPEAYRTVTILNSEPGMLDRNTDGTLTDEYLEDSIDIGQEIATGVTIVTATIIYDLVANSLTSLAKFKIGNSEERYLENIGQISPYSIYYQASPEYELEVLNTLSRESGR
jgi:hypothetical protein